MQPWSMNFVEKNTTPITMHHWCISSHQLNCSKYIGKPETQPFKICYRLWAFQWAQLQTSKKGLGSSLEFNDIPIVTFLRNKAIRSQHIATTFHCKQTSHGRVLGASSHVLNKQKLPCLTQVGTYRHFCYPLKNVGILMPHKEQNNEKTKLMANHFSITK